ncbi:adenylosuccinate lyase family protein [Corynebacterium sp.]|uniref:class-II fumarase/aspartase family protein n=1 Tax=Corynebacterium sp. TaxID=1720 RepID=UPI0028B1DB20|nr:adenylosuccinate lyase family protein [Corynebacterium sp.]
MPQDTFTLLSHLYADRSQQALFSEEATIVSWLRVEAALAQGQAAVGVLSQDDADAITAAATLDNVDPDRLWASARNVGYPILGIVREISRALPSGPDGRVHYGATTQDIMDTGLVLQLVSSLDLLQEQVGECGNAIATVVRTHSETIMPARTHAQHAVPTTLGASLATVLDELTRHLQRLRETRQRLATVSLAGAGGTSAAYGTKATQVREAVARSLNLYHSVVPWHTSRDRLAEFGHLYAEISATCARLARNIVDLSRTEIGEVFEKFDSHRGASSTMPQKVNPISSEAIIGLSQTVAGLASTMSRIQEAGHERAAGEWQLEWEVLPRIAVLTGSTVAETTDLAAGLRVDPERMEANLTLDHGLIMAEAHMISLAERLGRERAHDLVYEASQRARHDNETLTTALLAEARSAGLDESVTSAITGPEGYLGEAATIATTAVDHWSAVLSQSSDAGIER